MLIVVLVLAVVGLVVLAVAILTSNTILALVVIGLAVVGLLLLASDWFRDRRRLEVESTDEGDVEAEEHHEPLEPEATRDKPTLEPDLFEPDVSYEDAEEAEHHGGGHDSDKE